MSLKLKLKRIGVKKEYLIQRLEARRQALQKAVSAPMKGPNPVAHGHINTYGTAINEDLIQTMVDAYARLRLGLIEKSIKQPTPGSKFPAKGWKDTKSCWFDKEIILELLNQPDCVGLRIHYGIQTELKGQIGYHNVILVGLQEDEEKLRLESAEGLREHIDRTGSAAHYYKDMLSETEERLVVYPQGRRQAEEEEPGDNAYDFGGLGPPLPGPSSPLDA